MIDSDGWELAAYLDGILPVYLSFDVTENIARITYGLPYIRCLATVNMSVVLGSTEIIVSNLRIMTRFAVATVS